MEAKLEKIENSEAYIQIEVDAEKMEEGMEHAYRKVVKQVNVPGFRKGRVPRQLLESYYGKEILYQDALEFVVPSVYEESLEQLDIDPIAQPDFDIGEIEDGKPFVFQVVVPVKPEVKLGQLEELEISIPHFEIREEDVARSLSEMQEAYARLEEKADEPAENGDTVTIDFEGFVGDVAFEGGKGEDYPLELGSNTFIPGFEEQLVGVKSGQKVDIKVAFPEDYHAEDLAGKDAVFKVLVKGIETKKLRPLDDEFAQEVSEFDTMEELRTDIKRKLEETMEKQKKELISEEVLNKALEVCEIPVAKAVVKEQAERMMHEFERRMYTQGLNLEQYFNLTNSNEEQFIQDLWPEAEKRSKINFMLEKIVEQKGIEATDDEIDKHIEEIAGNMGLELEKAKENLAHMMDGIKFGLTMDKAVEYLVSNAKIEETDVNSAEAVTEDSEVEAND